MEAESTGRRKAIGTGGVVLLAGMTALGGRWPALLLVAIGAAMAVWGFWPNIKRHRGLWHPIEVGFLPAILAIPALSALPMPAESLGYLALTVLAKGWLGLWALCSTVIVLNYLGKGETSARRKSFWFRLGMSEAKSVSSRIQLERDLQGARAEVQELSQRLSHCTASYSAELDSARQSIESLAGERERLVKALTALSEHARYGESLREMESLSPDREAAIRVPLQRLCHDLDKVLTAGDKVWGALSFACKNRGQGSSAWWLDWYLYNDVVANLSRIGTFFREQLQFGRDPRPALATLYVRYGVWRAWAIRLAQLLDIELESIAGYAEWFNADARFVEEVRRNLNVSELVGVGDVVAAWDERNKNEPALPVPKVSS